MKLAVMSDIHGNLEALERVLEDMREQGADAMVCLGDLVGYGPDPEGVARRMIALNIPTVKGNHDRAVCRRHHLRWFNPVARSSLKRTMAMLSAKSMEYLEELPPYVGRYDCRFVHGFPPDSISKYLFQASESELKSVLSGGGWRRCFVGHTHELALIGIADGELRYEEFGAGPTVLEPNAPCIINVGSVGQPRDGDNKAKYVIWNSEAETLVVRYVPYDIARVAEAIVAAGLPPSHAERLW